MTTKRKREYLEYLQSEEWFAIRDKAFEFHGRICLDCSTKRNLQIHHLRYPRVFGQEDIEKDLCVLCKNAMISGMDLNYIRLKMSILTQEKFSTIV